MATTKTSWCVIGGVQGMGLDMVIYLLKASPSNFVVATSRFPDSLLPFTGLKSQYGSRLLVSQLDLRDEVSIYRCAKETEIALRREGGGLDYLVVNGAINAMNDSPLKFDPEDFVNLFRVNLLGPALAFRAFVPLLEKSKRGVVVNITCRQGCISKAAEQYGADTALYASSKAALNMFTIKSACERPDLIVLALSPGHNETLMGGEGAPLDPEDTCKVIFPFISSVTAEHSGKHWDYSGQEVVEYPCLNETAKVIGESSGQGESVKVISSVSNLIGHGPVHYVYEALGFDNRMLIYNQENNTTR